MSFPSHVDINTPTAKVGITLLFLLYLYFPVFLHLDVLPVLLWDESLFAFRALHLHRYGEYMINFNQFDGLPDHMNTKLPFTTFFQVLGLKLFGINELGLRLPIAFIFLATVFYISYYSKKYLGSMYIGFVFGAVLVSSTGFVAIHMLRTGDQDVPFACYILLGTLFFYRYLENYRTAPLVAFSFFMIAAFLTKNLLTGLVFPGLLAYVIYRGAFLRVLKDYRIYLALLAILGSYVGTVWYLEVQYPGFINRMWEYELLGRYTNEIEDHGGSIFYYVHLFFQDRFRPFGYFMLVALGLIADSRMKGHIRRLLVLCSFVFLFYLLGLSFSETKTQWYAAPLFPLASMIIALGVYHLYTCYICHINRAARYALVAAALAVMADYYAEVIDKVYKPKPVIEDPQYDLFTKEVKRKHPSLKDFIITDTSYGFSALFTVKKYNAKDEGYNISFQRSLDYEKGQHVLTCLNQDFDPLAEKYEYEMILEDEDCRMVKILGAKE